MRPRRFPPDHPDRVLKLEEEMEARLVALMYLAKDAGWHQEEFAAAVVSLARNYVYQLDANLETDIQIAKAINDPGRRLHSPSLDCGHRAIDKPTGGSNEV